MTKRLLLLAIICLMALGLLYIARKRTVPTEPPEKAPSPKAQPSRIPKEIKKDGRKVVGLEPGKETEQVRQLNLQNDITEEWQENLESILRTQGGDSLKTIGVKKIDSIIWNQDDIALYAESVIITLTHKNDSQTSFRALVDSQTGEILKTWDQPVFDPVHPRDNFKIRIDPRYHQD